MKEKNVKIGLKIGKIGNLAFARRRVLKKKRVLKIVCRRGIINFSRASRLPHNPWEHGKQG